MEDVICTRKANDTGHVSCKLGGNFNMKAVLLDGVVVT